MAVLGYAWWTTLSGTVAKFSHHAAATMATTTTSRSLAMQWRPPPRLQHTQTHLHHRIPTPSLGNPRTAITIGLPHFNNARQISTLLHLIPNHFNNSKCHKNVHNSQIYTQNMKATVLMHKSRSEGERGREEKGERGSEAAATERGREDEEERGREVDDERGREVVDDERGREDVADERGRSAWSEKAKAFLHQHFSGGGDAELDDKYVPLRRIKRQSRQTNVREFVDYRRVVTSGGDGGNGSISFLSVLMKEFAGPDGADGGNGGHVIFKACSGMRSLGHTTSVVRAESGEDGRNKHCTGRSAPNTIVEVPVGTMFKANGGEVVASLEKDGSMFVAARGGAGGKGNAFFTTDVDQAPRVAEFGGRGESVEYEVELRIMADVGLIGFPNVGKSTLLRAVSRARPKVASYPFTTLNPHVGIIHYADHHQLAVADLPGLVEGAHRNRGLGFQFLRHVQRCACLLYVVDMSQPSPWRQLQVLRNELEQYERGLSARPHAVVANKMDLPQAQENLAEFGLHVDLPVLAVSAKMGDQLLPLMALLRLLVEHNNNNNNSHDES